MAPSPYIFIISIGPVDMNKYARLYEIPSMTLKDIKETKRYGRTDGRTDGQCENSIPTHKHSLRGGYKNQYIVKVAYCKLLLNGLVSLKKYT